MVLGGRAVSKFTQGQRRARTYSRFRLLGACIGTLFLVCTGLYAAQAHQARSVSVADGGVRHLEQGKLLEHLYESANAIEDPWDELGEGVRLVSATNGGARILVIAASGRVMAASATADERTLPSRTLTSGGVAFEETSYGGHEAFEYKSLIWLDDKPYTFEVEFEPAVLAKELASLRLTTLRVFAVGAVVALPLLYLLGGRRLANRYSVAEGLAIRDGLTGLNNHRAFQEAVAHEVAQSQRYGEALTLALIDIDDFKFVNDNLGHRKGDEVLVQLATALQSTRSVDRAFRIGGDEFALLMPRTGLDEAVEVVERLRSSSVRRMLGTTISIGVVELSPDADAEVLRDRADNALHEAKRCGRDQVVTFASIVEQTPTRISGTTVTAVRNLLATRRMGAAYQPIWNLVTQRVIGYEGLARPAIECGLAGPQDAFEGAVLLGRVDELDALCRSAVLAGVNDLPDGVLLFLNISPEVFDHGAQAVELLRDEVMVAGLHPRQVAIELTEHASERMDLVIDQVRRLREFGFLLALDDVGTGDTSLGLLGQVQPDYVKVDQTVVRGALEQGPERAILAAILAYAGECGATVIAEGIETDGELEMVRGMGTDVERARIVGVQGYLLGRPSTHAPWRQATGSEWPLQEWVPCQWDLDDEQRALI